MAKAVWNGAVIAESANTVVVDGNHYFPPESIKSDFFRESDTRTVCGWKGEANYYHLNVSGETNEDAAWCYKTPKDAAKNIKDHIAFWKGVEVTA